MKSGADLLHCWNDHRFQSFDSWDRNTFRNKNKYNPLLEIHGPCFHAFLVLINPLWWREGFKINYSLQNWQTTLRTPEHILDVSSVSVSAAQDDRQVFERGHSWNVNTQKESSILQSPGLCHASIFHFSFLCVCILVRQTEDGTLQLYCVLVPGFVHPCGLLAMSRLWAMLLWSPPEQWHIHSFCRPCEIRLHVLLRPFGNPELWKEPLSLRLHGCCSWCRFALLGKLKEKDERGDWESNEVKVNYCNLWDDED